MLNVLRYLNSKIYSKLQVKLRAGLAIATVAAASVAVGTTGCSNQQFALGSSNATFAQKASYISNVDVLWVIDSSGSMTPRQAGLASQVSSFVDKLNQTGLNYNMAVTTMDMSSAGARGHFIAQAGTPTVLNAATPNLIATLQDRLQPGATGSILAKGMDSVKAALTSPLITGANSGFLRSDATLVLIFLSDDNDKSTSFDDVAFLNSIKPPLANGDKAWVAQFLGVTPDDPNCKSAEWSTGVAGTRYINMASASGGTSQSICDSDFGRALTNVHKVLVSLLVEFSLDQVPNISTIQVSVNGVIIPKSDTNGWTYDSTNNAIRFHGDAVPAPNASIHVDFTPSGMK